MGNSEKAQSLDQVISDLKDRRKALINLIGDGFDFRLSSDLDRVQALIDLLAAKSNHGENKE